MGLDFGDKKIGVALSDTLGITAQAKTVIHTSNKKEALKQIKKLIKENEVKEIVVGLPKNMNGSLGFRADITNKFVDFLKQNLNISIKLWDERLSSAEAEKLLISADLSRAKRKKVIDKLAAALILQSYLDANNRREGG